MTPEQRLNRAERILTRMIKSGRRSRSEFSYKINSLIDAQIRHEEIWQAESHEVNEKLKAVAVVQAELTESQKLTAKSLTELAESQKLTDKALRDFIDSHHKRENGNI
jgi:hypothetical protein